MSRKKLPPSLSLSRPITRRTFLQWSGTTVVALSACTPEAQKSDPPDAAPPIRPVTDPDAFDNATTVALDPASVTEDLQLFAYGVQSGSMTDRAVTFRSHSADGADKVLRVWRTAAEPGSIKLVHESTLTPNDGGFFSARVDGLAPDTMYNYALFSSGDVARSVIGRVRTAYPPGMRWPITLACSTCTNFRTVPYKSLLLTAEHDVDAFLHVGDMSYNDGSVTLEQYREKWKRTLGDPGYLATLPRQGSYIVWDDHEFVNDLNPQRMDPTHMETAKQAFFEALPMERGSQGQLWQSFRWGDTVELILLDCRTEREPDSIGTGAEVYISRAQMDFLKQALRESPCHFKVVLNSVPMVKFPDTFWANQNDRWQGYEAAREEILDFMEAEGLDNVWFISGDFHLGYVARLEQEGFRSRIFDIAVGPGGNYGNPLAGLSRMSDELKEDIFPAAQFFHGDDAIAMTLLTFDPLKDSVRIQFVDAETRETRFETELSRSS